MNLLLFCSIFITSLHLIVDAMYNGEYRSVKDYPYMTQLYHEFEDDTISYCGATILSEYWVVSAAHCFRHKNIFKSQVRVGSSSTAEQGTLIDIEKVFVHGDCDPEFAYDSDIALIKLKTPIDFNEYQLPIQISKEMPKIGDNITVLGFGYHHHDVDGYSLRGAQTSIIEDESCLKSFEGKYTKNMICTSVKNIDLCSGDSGGPAVQNNKLIGVISQGCEYTKPNVLTKVPNYYEWILHTTGINYVD